MLCNSRMSRLMISLNLLLNLLVIILPRVVLLVTPISSTACLKFYVVPDLQSAMSACSSLLRMEALDLLLRRDLFSFVSTCHRTHLKCSKSFFCLLIIESQNAFLMAGLCSSQETPFCLCFGKWTFIR